MADGSGGLKEHVIKVQAEHTAIVKALQAGGGQVMLSSGAILVVSDMKGISPGDTKKKLPVAIGTLQGLSLPYQSGV